MSAPRLLASESTAAIILGADDWTEAGLNTAPSFRRSAKGIAQYLVDRGGLGLDASLLIDLFNSREDAGSQLAEIRDTLDRLLRERRDEGRPVTDLLLYYVGHGQTDDQGHLSLLVRRTRRGMEIETSIGAPDLARVLKIAAPQQRRIVFLDCCFSEAAARAFVGMSGSLEQAVAATAAKDLKNGEPNRGTLLMCSSPVGEVSMAPSGETHTLFTGAVLKVLHEGIEGSPAVLSLADLRDGSYARMVLKFGANAPRPVLHQTNATLGDLTRIPAFANRQRNVRAEAPVRAPENGPPSSVPGGYDYANASLTSARGNSGNVNSPSRESGVHRDRLIFGAIAALAIFGAIKFGMITQSSKSGPQASSLLPDSSASQVVAAEPSAPSTGTALSSVSGEASPPSESTRSPPRSPRRVDASDEASKRTLRPADSDISASAAQSAATDAATAAMAAASSATDAASAAATGAMAAASSAATAAMSAAR